MEEELGFRPLIDPSSTLLPVKQLFSGFEIEDRQLLLSLEKDHTKKGNALTLYNEILTDGVLIEQGYIKEIPVAAEVLTKLGVKLSEFKPNTIRFRKFGDNYKLQKVSRYRYVLTLKNNKETKKREAEFKLSKAQFDEFWELTKGNRILKKRLRKTIKGHDFELDAFCDRILLIAECEVTSEKALDKVPQLGMSIRGDKNFTNKALSR